MATRKKRKRKHGSSRFFLAATPLDNAKGLKTRSLQTLSTSSCFNIRRGFLWKLRELLSTFQTEWRNFSRAARRLVYAGTTHVPRVTLIDGGRPHVYLNPCGIRARHWRRPCVAGHGRKGPRMPGERRVTLVRVMSFLLPVRLSCRLLPSKGLRFHQQSPVAAILVQIRVGDRLRPSRSGSPRRDATPDQS